MPKKNQASLELVNDILVLRKLGKGRNTICKELKCSMSDVRYILELHNLNSVDSRPAKTHQICKICKDKKELSEFRKREKNGRTFYEVYCFPCDREYKKEYNRKLYLKQRKQRLITAKEHRDKPENQERRREYENIYSKKRKAEDPQYKLRRNISSYIGSCLIRNDGNKWNESIMKYLDYSIEELKTHLESQFEPWMSWENWGRYLANEWDEARPETWKWQIDHIIPAITFTYDKMDHPEFKECWGLHNLRPLSAKQNVIEGARKSNINE